MNKSKTSSLAEISDLDATEVHHALEVGLTEAEFLLAKTLIKKAPNKLELGIISAMWSEHCSYKSSRMHLKKFPKASPRVLVGPGENAGVIDVGDGLAVAFKVESHNHPSFIEPFQGAATGVGGILRDVFTMGARPFATMNLLRFGAPDHAKTSHLLRGVVGGISSYGNSFGVPTVVSDVAFDPCYNGNILVNAFAIGVLKHDAIFLGTAKGKSNPVFYVGAKTGRDGIHGATMASDGFSEEKEAKRPTVQVGDPFKEKLLLEACHECFAQNLLVGIQDMGAAGLTSSSFEMAARGNSGLLLHLDRVPTREAGMTPYELMLSESQERMLLVAKKGNERALIEIFSRWDLDCVQIGEVIDEPVVRLMWHGVEYAALSPSMLTDEAPVYDRPQEKPNFSERVDVDEIKGTSEEILLRLMSHPTLVDQTWNTEQYDHHIGLGTLLGPGEADAALVQIPGSEKAVALAIHCDSRACALDPDEGARRTLARAVMQVSCVGASPIGVSDCLNYGSPVEGSGMWQLAQGIEGLAEAARVFDVPVVSGNVSLYNQTDDRAIYPTPTVAVVGLHESPTHRATHTFKQVDDLIVYVGSPAETMSGAELLFDGYLQPRGLPTKWNLRNVASLAKCLAASVAKGDIDTAAHVGKGGLLVTLLKMSLLGKAGVHLSLNADWASHINATLFSDEVPGFVLGVRPNKLTAIESAFVSVALVQVIGVVAKDRFACSLGREKLFDLSTDFIAERYGRALSEVACGRTSK